MTVRGLPLPGHSLSDPIRLGWQLKGVQQTVGDSPFASQALVTGRILFWVYCVEKLLDTGISIVVDNLSTSNSLFLLGGISSETPKSTDLGVFQQNRSIREISTIFTEIPLCGGCSISGSGYRRVTALCATCAPTSHGTDPRHEWGPIQDRCSPSPCRKTRQ